MSINFTAIQRGGLLAKHKIAKGKKHAGSVGMFKVASPNRAMRSATKQRKAEPEYDFAELTKAGAIAWADVPNATAWVDELRGGDAE